MLYGLDVSQPQLHNQRPDTKPLNDYDLAVTGYGQGEILMSPLQMACYASAYANNGVDHAAVPCGFHLACGRHGLYAR